MMYFVLRKVYVSLLKRGLLLSESWSFGTRKVYLWEVKGEKWGVYSLPFTVYSTKHGLLEMLIRTFQFNISGSERYITHPKIKIF